MAAASTRLSGLLGRVLQTGVGVSAAVALLGGSIYLGRHGASREGDRTYVAICLFVLAMLLVGLLGGIG